MPDDFWANAVFSLTPTILVGLIFWFVMRSIFRADRTERSEYAKIDAQERARLGMPVPSPADTSAAGTASAASPSAPVADTAAPTATR